MISQEKAFELGAKAMQSKIVAHLMLKGLVDQAVFMLNLSMPDFQIPESIELKAKDSMQDK